MDINEIKYLKPGDKVLVECTVEAVFTMSGMVMVTTRDCDKGFDAYCDEVYKKKNVKKKNTKRRKR